MLFFWEEFAQDPFKGYTGSSTKKALTSYGRFRFYANLGEGAPAGWAACCRIIGFGDVWRQSRAATAMADFERSAEYVLVEISDFHKSALDRCQAFSWSKDQLVGACSSRSVSVEFE